MLNILDDKDSFGRTLARMLDASQMIILHIRIALSESFRRPCIIDLHQKVDRLILEDDTNEL